MGRLWWVSRLGRRGILGFRGKVPKEEGKRGWVCGVWDWEFGVRYGLSFRVFIGLSLFLRWGYGVVVRAGASRVFDLK